ncbi:hypothetical protein [Halopiger xanaduensis]|uniref:DUF8119 domain-containing protein n=1 Tax=Halopiger xanaduensis (strain DSM 18323 / JCM 14033 / SH-6) TaxID=797210 RepID=F8DCT9_HALXS|nr:hypothetical protein [Halopiger xanaduensis]AEH37266.1 hypothetical protein Halxa_2649 [Halopiger xanaduensis SH-6]
MSDDATRTRSTSGAETAVRAVARLGADLLVVTLWVVFLTVLFLETAWPRWLFYALLLLGVGGYVSVTAAWTKRG